VELVDERDLDIIAEDCYLVNAPDGVDKLPNKPKRPMLHWGIQNKLLFDWERESRL